jgi:hypothetical protein
LSCPEDIFDASFFQENPSPFYRFAKNIYFPLLGKNGAQADGPGNETKTRLRPSDSHKLLSLLEQKKKLLRVYSQNIDGTKYIDCDMICPSEMRLPFLLILVIRLGRRGWSIEQTGCLCPWVFAVLYL